MKTPYVVTIHVGSAGSDVGVLPEPTGDVDAVQAVADATSAMLAWLSRRLLVPDPEEATGKAWDTAIFKNAGRQET